ncbi:DUF2835 family protein [Glaciecola petra]|uniref:DUF2835 family protein n=1 Tax=Glaciecola petra TaxID=3075602 RepID=UPI003D77B786
MKNTKYYFSVSMSYAECENLYHDQIQYLVVTSTEGKRIQLPKQNMQKFVSLNGLHGMFVMEVDRNNKIKMINKYESR